MKTIFENNWCKILSKGTIYILHSKADKYNDQYFNTLDAAFRAIGRDIYSYKGKLYQP